MNAEQASLEKTVRLATASPLFFAFVVVRLCLAFAWPIMNLAFQSGKLLSVAVSGDDLHKQLRNQDTAKLSSEEGFPVNPHRRSDLHSRRIACISSHLFG